jgi:ATPase subunit of ABC transporter with duplicated ATPase domains
MNIIVWFILALYFDKVVPNDNGYGEHPLFFLFPSYWGYNDPKWMQRSSRTSSVPKSSLPPAIEDSDVKAERENAKSIPVEAQKNMRDDPIGMRIMELHKRYDSGIKALLTWLYGILGLKDESLHQMSPKLGQSKVAIHELSLTVNKGSMLALLGSNGAGKTSKLIWL